MAGINISLVGTYGGGCYQEERWPYWVFSSATSGVDRPSARRWGRSVGYTLTALVALEIGIDVFVPQVSGAGHAGGLIFGVLAGVSRLSGDMDSIQRDEKNSLKN